MQRLILILFLTFGFLMPSIQAQIFQRAVFVEKKTGTEREFYKGQKLKVVCKSTRGVSFDYRGRLTEIARDSIFLNIELGKIGLPLSSVVKIQKPGIALWGVIALVGGLICLLAGLYFRLIEETSDTFLVPLGVEKMERKGLGLIIAGTSLLLVGLFLAKNPSVKHPNKNWELRTEYVERPKLSP